MQATYEENSTSDAADASINETHILRARSIDKRYAASAETNEITTNDNDESDADLLNNTATNDDNANDGDFFVINSEKDLLDPTMQRFIEKGFNLGFTLDLIIDLLKHTPRTIDEEKFIENLILYSIQNDMEHNAADEDDEDCDEDYMDPDDKPAMMPNHQAKMALSQNANAKKQPAPSGNQLAKQISQPEIMSHPYTNTNDYQHFKYNPANTTKMNIQDNEFMKAPGDCFANNNNNNNNNSNKLLATKKAIEATVSTKTASKASIKKQQDQEMVNQMREEFNDKKNLRPIVIDGNDVALSRNDQNFSLQRIKSVAEYFDKRDHQIYLVLPWARNEAIMAKPDDKEFLDEIMKMCAELVVPQFKDTGTKKIVCDDDILVLRTAQIKSAVIVSNDNFRKFIHEFKEIIEERVLMYTFIDNNFIPADDPLGKGGPTLEAFIRFKWFNERYLIPCPFGKKCTFGLKCKYIHAERGTHQQAFKTAHQNVLDTQARERERFASIIKNASGSDGAVLTKSSKTEASQQFAQMLNNGEASQFAKSFAASQAKNANAITMIKRGVQGMELQPKQQQQQKMQQKSPFDVDSEQKSNNMVNNSMAHSNWGPFSCSSELIKSGADMHGNSSYFQQRVPQQHERLLIARGFATKTPTEMFDFPQNMNQQKPAVNMKTQKPRLQKPMNQNPAMKKEWQQQPFNYNNFNNWTNTNNSNTNSNRPVINNNETSKPTEKYTHFPNPNPSMSNMYYEASTLMQNVNNPFEPKQLKLNVTDNTSSFNHNLYSRLLRRLPEEKARWVMETYKDETDEDTLVFLAEDKSFFD